MKRLWEIVVSARGIERFYCFPFRIVFRLITPLYQAFSRRHLRRRCRRCSGGWRAKVISIGNITVGGSGKTPIVVYLAGQYIAGGKKVVVVHSGYGRKHRRDLLVGYNEGADLAADQVGDETAMMARMMPQAGFAVGCDKKKLVTLADQNLAPDVILIDDGFQRRDIRKDLDIVVIEEMILTDDRETKRAMSLYPFPRGILREEPAVLSRADAVFVTRTAVASNREATVRRYNDTAPVIPWQLVLEGVEENGVVAGLDKLADRRPFLFAGIGSYRRLEEMIRAAGVALQGEYDFGDHFDYDASDISMLRGLAVATGADCYLTTAKDMVKLTPSDFDRPLLCLRLAVRPDHADRLRKLIGLAT